MTLFIPEIGNKLELEKDWKFVLYTEYRNNTLISKLNKKGADSYVTTLPAGTILTVARIYIKKGAGAYSSVTFNISKENNRKSIYSGTKFWASLSDVNRIEYKLISCNEATLEVIKSLNDILKEIIPDTQTHYVFMSTFLNDKITTIRPVSEPYIFLLEGIERINLYKQELLESFQYDVDKFDECIKIIETSMRKYKITSILGSIS